MSGQRPSSTAVGAAILRAAHRLIDDEPRLLDDPLAAPLCGLPDEAASRIALDAIQREFVPYGDAALARDIVLELRATILLRNRYAEDRLQDAMAGGVDQYVMLGAGLDSFAHRRHDLLARLQVFELDLPATQTWKRARLAQLGVPSPSRLHYVETDFERQTPLQALGGSAFDASRPAVFSWLGVTSYLSEAAVFATLRDLAGAAAGSVIVFSYALAESLVDERGRRISAALKARVAARNEPAAHGGFRPDALTKALREMGYGDIEDLDVAGAQQRYFASRGDGLASPPMTQLMSAVVGAR